MKKAILQIIPVLLCFCAAPLAAAPPERIVSLAPALTEILYALGLERNIAGVTDFCDFPPEARKKPKVGGMSNPSIEAVISLRPDIAVLTTDGNPKDFEKRLRTMGIKTYIFRARRVRELPQAIRKMGSALGAGEKADELASKVENSLKDFREKTMGKSRKKMLFIVWPEPLIAAGPHTLADDAIKILGHENIASGAPIPYPKYSLEEVIRQDPDVIIIGRGHGIKEASGRLLKRLGSLHAVKKGNVFYVGDGLYRLGPRIIPGIDELRTIMEGLEDK